MAEQTGGPAEEKEDRYARQRADEAAAQTADFDAWRASRHTEHGPTIRIGGQAYSLPKQPPLMFTLERQRLQGELSEADVRRMVGMLYGATALDEFVAAGLDHDDLGVLLLWGGANCGATDGERITLDAAQDEYDRMQREAAEGKGLNREARRTAKRKRGAKSSATGR